MSAVHCIYKANAKLGECPRWNPTDQKIYWTDIDARKIWRMTLDGDNAQCAKLEQKTGCFAFREDGGMILAMEKGVYVADPFVDPCDLRMLCPHPDPEHSATGGRFNDGRCDAQGRLLVGTVDPQRAGKAKLYCLEPHADRMRLVQDNFTTFNGLAFHPHRSEVWYTDTPTRQVYRSTYDLQTGTLNEREIIYSFAPDNPARPDGACFDSDGNYWCAMYAGGSVCKISDSGELLGKVAIPATYTTMPAFADAALSSMVVTSAQREDDLQEKQMFPDAGGVFLISGLTSRGCSEHLFRG